MKRFNAKWFPLLLALMIGLAPLSPVTAEPLQALPPAPEAMMHAHSMADSSHAPHHCEQAGSTQQCAHTDTDHSCTGSHCSACGVALLHAAPRPDTTTPGAWLCADTIHQLTPQPSLLFRPPRA
ncbi:MAG TPA: hypothetical protein VIQ22_03815 [Gammaproteobacteria bacterium]